MRNLKHHQQKAGVETSLLIKTRAKLLRDKRNLMIENHKLGSDKNDAKIAEIENKLKSIESTIKNLDPTFFSDKELSAIADDPQVKSLESTIENLLNQIRNLNKRLDNKNLSKEQKDSIHDQLDRLKDRRKETNIRLSNLKIKLGNKMKTAAALETAGTWFDELSDKEQQDYLKEHKNSKLLPRNKLKEHHETVRDLNKQKIQHLNAGNLDKVKEINKKISPAWNAIMDHNKEQHEKQGDYNVKTGRTTKEQQEKIDKSWGYKRELSKIKETASEWFESLTKKQQQEYIKEHPDSKYSHKLGTSNSDKSKVKDKKIIKEHLEGEGINFNKYFYELPFNDKHKLNTVHKLSGKSASSKGASRGRALHETLQKVKDNKPSSDNLKGHAEYLLKEIDEAEKKFNKEYKSGNTDKAIEIRKAINILKDGYMKLTGVESFRHHEKFPNKEQSTFYSDLIKQGDLILSGREENNFVKKVFELYDAYQKLNTHEYSKDVVVGNKGITIEVSPDNWHHVYWNNLKKIADKLGMIAELRPRFKGGDISHKTPPVIFIQFPTTGVFSGQIADLLEKRFRVKVE